MVERIKFFVGLDAHKDSIVVSACEAGRESARFVGTMGPDVNGLLKLLVKAGDPAQVGVVYEVAPPATAFIASCARAAIEARSWQCR
jgi:hypothetical protein